jgi:hypothetical protein
MKKIFITLVVAMLTFAEVNAQRCEKSICISTIVNGKDTLICYGNINTCDVIITNEMIKPATKPDIIDPNDLTEIVGKLGFKIKKISGSIFRLTIFEKATKKILVSRELKKTQSGGFVSPASYSIKITEKMLTAYKDKPTTSLLQKLVTALYNNQKIILK